MLSSKMLTIYNLNTEHMVNVIDEVQYEVQGTSGKYCTKYILVEYHNKLIMLEGLFDELFTSDNLTHLVNKIYNSINNSRRTTVECNFTLILIPCVLDIFNDIAQIIYELNYNYIDAIKLYLSDYFTETEVDELNIKQLCNLLMWRNSYYFIICNDSNDSYIVIHKTLNRKLYISENIVDCYNFLVDLLANEDIIVDLLTEMYITNTGDSYEQV